MSTLLLMLNMYELTKKENKMSMFNLIFLLPAVLKIVVKKNPNLYCVKH